VSGAVSDVDMMLEVAESLLASVFPFICPVRLLGVTLSSLNTEESGKKPQLDLGL
jgi:DNA polymerase-4